MLLADDHGIVREGLRALVEAEPGLYVVGEAADGQEAWQRSCELKPDVLVLDLSMPVASGADAATRIARDCPTVRILALTMHEERGYVARLLKAGAAGYVLKRTASAELVRAIRVVASGGSYIDPSLAATLLTDGSVQRGPVDGRSIADITAREREIIRHVALGYTNKELASTFDISVKTVETHKANAMAKLGLTSRAALVRFAMQQGWMDER